MSNSINLITSEIMHSSNLKQNEDRLKDFINNMKSSSDGIDDFKSKLKDLLASLGRLKNNSQTAQKSYESAQKIIDKFLL